MKHIKPSFWLFALVVLACFIVSFRECSGEITVELPPGADPMKATNNFVIFLKPGTSHEAARDFESDLKAFFTSRGHGNLFVSSFFSPYYNSLVVKGVDKGLLLEFLAPREFLILKVEQSVAYTHNARDSGFTILEEEEEEANFAQEMKDEFDPEYDALLKMQEKVQWTPTYPQPERRKHDDDDGPSMTCQNLDGSYADATWALDVMDYDPDNDDDLRDDKYCYYSHGAANAHIWVLDCGIQTRNTHLKRNNNIIAEYAQKLSSSLLPAPPLNYYI